MGVKASAKLAVDMAMTILLMLLMAFELVGRSAHEWLGMGMFVLFVLHHLLNRRWTASLLRGRYTSYRILQTAVAGLVFLAMLGSFVSAVPISRDREVFAFLSIRRGMALGRVVHLLCAYWGFVLLSLHLGLHWGNITAMAGRCWGHPPRAGRIALRVLGAAIAVAGAYALVRRDIPDYLFLRTQFVFFDHDEPRILFFLDYMAAMGLFVWAGPPPACAWGRSAPRPGSRWGSGPPPSHSPGCGAARPPDPGRKYP